MCVTCAQDDQGHTVCDLDDQGRHSWSYIIIFFAWLFYILVILNSNYGKILKSSVFIEVVHFRLWYT